MTRKFFLAAALMLLAISPILAKGISKNDLAGPTPAALQDISSGPKPAIYIRTDQVVYLPGDSITVVLSMNNNGHLFSKTLFLYLQNMETGVIQYLNTAEGGPLPAGEITDIVGSSLDSAQTFPIVNVEDGVLIGDGGIILEDWTAPQVGTYQIVFELRDPTGQRIFQRNKFDFAVVNEIVTLPGEITTDTTLTADAAYLLDNQASFVRPGATLTIEPGVYILGQGVGSLFVDRGATIMAVGTQRRPIVMTSAQPVGDRGVSDWGGFTVSGEAVINTPGGEAQGEGGTGPYGGDNDDDNSGRIVYVRVEFAGIEFSPDNELNGIAFQGVGRNTEIRFIQVHFNKDDGIEFFGGTANAKYVLLTSNADDSLDWTFGWRGKLQFVIIQQNKADADQGIEADGNAENNTLEPFSNPTIYNMTMIGGRPAEGSQEESDIGILLREGTQATIRNAIVVGFGQQAVVIDYDVTVTQANDGEIKVTNSIFANNATREPAGGQFARGSNGNQGLDVATFITAAGSQNRVGVDPGLRDPFNLVTPDFRPKLESPARDVNFVSQPPDDGFFMPVTFIGGVDPLHDWTTFWTTSAPD